MNITNEKSLLAQEIYKNYSIYLNASQLLELHNSFEKIQENKSNLEIRKGINDFIKSNYLNETVIKSLFIKNVVFKQKLSTCIYEFPVGSSRVDLCCVRGKQGKSTGYEIKTDLDNLNRLHKQLDDYRSIFDEIYVICSEKKLDSIIQLIDNSIGIYLFKINKNNKVSFNLFRKKPASSNLSFV